MPSGSSSRRPAHLVGRIPRCRAGRPSPGSPSCRAGGRRHRRARSTASGGVAGLSARPAAQPASRTALERVVHVRSGLPVHGDRVRAGVGEVLDVALGALDHQVHVEHPAASCTCSRSAFTISGPDRDRRHEVAVHHVHVDHPRAGVHHLLRPARRGARSRRPGSTGPRGRRASARGAKLIPANATARSAKRRAPADGAPPGLGRTCCPDSVGSYCSLRSSVGRLLVVLRGLVGRGSRRRDRRARRSRSGSAAVASMITSNWSANTRSLPPSPQVILSTSPSRTRKRSLPSPPVERVADRVAGSGHVAAGQRPQRVVAVAAVRRVGAQVGEDQVGAVRRRSGCRRPCRRTSGHGRCRR